MTGLNDSKDFDNRPNLAKSLKRTKLAMEDAADDNHDIYQSFRLSEEEASNYEVVKKKFDDYF